MPNILNKPSEETAIRAMEALERSDETAIRAAEALEKIAETRTIADFSNAPGSKYLLAGARDTFGYFGIVPSTDFITGDALASLLGITAGSSINSDTPWIKLIKKGKVLFYPLKPLRHSITHNDIYEAGAVYGTGNEGTLPPNGRLGTNLSIDSSDNSINTTGHFKGDQTSGMDYADTVCVIGDTVTLKGWANGANNGEFTVVSITDSKIVLSGTLVSESGNKNGKIYENSKAVNQNATVVIDGITYRVRLMKMADNDPLDSYNNADRDMIGPNSEWNNLILPLMIGAKTGDWNYPQYAGDVEDWNVHLTDLDMILHYTLGSGSRRWGQEVSDVTSWRRVLRGSLGASHGDVPHSFYVHSYYAFAPVLERL